MKRDYYSVLGVDRSASDGEVKKAFRRLARELHPDVNRHDPDAEAKFKEAAEAYEILADGQRRATYDRYGHEGLSGAGAGDFSGFGSVSDIFEAFFGSAGPLGGDGFGAGGGRRAAPRGPDLATEVEIGFVEAAFGLTRRLDVEVVDTCDVCGGDGAKPGTKVRQCGTCGGLGQVRAVQSSPFGQIVRTTVCPTCQGEGRQVEQACVGCRGRGRRAVRRTVDVTIPAGIDDGQRLRLTGRGHAGAAGSRPGDLYVTVAVTPDPRFSRDGSHLDTEVELTMVEAALGATKQIAALEGEEALQLAAGTQPGEVVRLKARGFPSVSGGGRGDLRVHVRVLVPRGLDGAQRRAVEQVGDAVGERHYHRRVDENHDGSFFDRLRGLRGAFR